MSEAGYVELPVIAWFSGHGCSTPGLGFDPDDANPPFLKPAVEKLAKADRA